MTYVPKTEFYQCTNFILETIKQKEDFEMAKPKR